MDCEGDTLIICPRYEYIILNMVFLMRKILCFFAVILTLWSPTVLAACSNNDTPTGQDSIIPVGGKVAEIVERGKILVGTTGDYRPLSFREADGTYWGFGIEVAQEIARNLGVEIEFVKTSWPTLTTDVLAEPQTFDMAIGGITITDARREKMLMSEGYLANGKTILFILNTVCLSSIHLAEAFTPKS